MSFSINGLEIFAVGKWNGDSYTQKDLEAMVASFDKVGFAPPLKLGHTEDQKFLQKDGLPAAGWVDRIYVKGDKLLADVSRIPKKVYALLKNGAYRHVSSEIYWNLKRGDSVFSRVLKAVALLGVETPAVSGLSPIDAMLSQYMKAYKASVEDTKAYTFAVDITEQFKEDTVDEKQKKDKDSKSPGSRRMGDHLDKEDKKNNKDDDKKQGEKKMSEEAVKKLQEQMKEMQKNMAAASKEHKDTVESYKEDLAKKDEKVTALGGALVTLQNDKITGEIKSFTAEMVAAGKMVPAITENVSKLFTALSQMDSTVKFFNKDKKEVEETVLNFAKTIFSSMPVVVEYKELADGGDDSKELDADAEKKLDTKIEAYATEHKVEYGEALIAVLAKNPALAKQYYDNQGK